jgi:hypothetical protein
MAPGRLSQGQFSVDPAQTIHHQRIHLRAIAASAARSLNGAASSVESPRFPASSAILALADNVRLISARNQIRAAICEANSQPANDLPR